MENQNFKNVSEAQLLYDTVLVCNDVNDWEFHDGWTTTFALLGAQIEIPFFNVRNRNHGLPYNNQDTRDQTAYGMQIYSMGVSFFAPQIASQLFESGRTQWDVDCVEEIHSPIWEADLPRHASITLRINQDDRIRHQVAMAPPGYGPFGGGMGHGDPNQWGADAASQDIPSIMKGATTQSVPENTNRWKFPVPIDVPRRATISAVLKFSEYARQLLQTMAGPGDLWFWDSDNHVSLVKSSCFGIQLSLQVKRYVQQRGEYWS